VEETSSFGILREFETKSIKAMKIAAVYNQKAYCDCFPTEKNSFYI